VKFKFSEKKFTELVLYIAARCEKRARFGATKLNKILFYADFMAVEQRGRPITGASYQRLRHGPAPKALKPITEEMRRKGSFAWQETPLGPRAAEKRPIALRPPDLRIFDADEISLVDMAIEALIEQTAAEVSESSHRFPGWALARDQEEIPYATVLLSPGPIELSPGEMQWARSEVAEFTP
jgi:hypothetical protein